MSVLVYIENKDGNLSKRSLALASYASQLSSMFDCKAIALSLGKVADEELSKLGRYGIRQILTSDDDFFKLNDNAVLARVISDAAESVSASVIVMSADDIGAAVAPRVAVRMNAALGSAVVGLPVSLKPFVVNKHLFNGKIISQIELTRNNKVLTVAANTFSFVEQEVDMTIESFDSGLVASDCKLVLDSVIELKNKVLLQDAEIVVSGGRGMRSADNWSGLEQLSDTLGAALACSRPVSDEGWRPHQEHVGQTGKVISPNLYMAFGISGAIQHLGGVSSSKCIVAVNTDASAPIFEVADYGIVGNVDEVIPRLNEAVVELKKQ